MKLDLTLLESEPLLYFLKHSGVFVVGLGLLFFILGVWFGALTWGWHRRQNKKLRLECESLREEVAGLKRKLAEQSLRSSQPSALSPLPHTEPLPSIPSPQEGTPNGAPNHLHVPLADTLPSKGPHFSFLLEETEDTSKSLTALKSVIHSVPTPAPPAMVGPQKNPPLPPAPPEDEPSCQPFSFLLDDEPELTPVQAQEKAVQDAADDDSFLPESFLLDPEEAEDADLGFPTFLSPSSSVPSPLLPAALPSVLPEQDPSLGLIYLLPPDEKDDLTQIHGISAILQARLNDLGIYRFEQIATWTPSQVREFSHRLAFKDRIERENWVSSARLLTGSAKK